MSPAPSMAPLSPNNDDPPRELVASSAESLHGRDCGKIDWREAYNSHEDGLRKLAAHRMGEERSAVDDVMQEVAIAVLGAEATKARPDDPKKIGAWLRSVTIHKVQDFWRKVQRTRRLRDRLEHSASHFANDAGSSPYDWVLRIENIGAVRGAMNALETADRELLEQKYREDVTCRELAARQGVAIKTIEYRLKHARAQLRRILQKEIHFSDQ